VHAFGELGAQAVLADRDLDLDVRIVFSADISSM